MKPWVYWAIGIAVVAAIVGVYLYRTKKNAMQSSTEEVSATAPATA